MKKRNIVIILICAGIGLPVAWYLLSPLFTVIEADDAVPFEASEETGSIEETDQIPEIDEEEELVQVEEKPRELFYAEFIPEDHDVTGAASVIEYGDERILRFEDFETVNGPNLHIYLATDTSAADYVDLGEIRATKGNVNYEIDPEVDLETYDTVLVWCVPFKVLFSYAELR